MPEPIGGLIVVDLNGYSGNLNGLVRAEITATGLRVTMRGPLAMALQLSAGKLSDTNHIGVTLK